MSKPQQITVSMIRQQLHHKHAALAEIRAEIHHKNAALAEIRAQIIELEMQANQLQRDVEAALYLCLDSDNGARVIGLETNNGGQ